MGWSLLSTKIKKRSKKLWCRHTIESKIPKRINIRRYRLHINPTCLCTFCQELWYMNTLGSGYDLLTWEKKKEIHVSYFCSPDRCRYSFFSFELGTYYSLFNLVLCFTDSFVVQEVPYSHLSISPSTEIFEQNTHLLLIKIMHFNI